MLNRGLLSTIVLGFLAASLLCPKTGLAFLCAFGDTSNISKCPYVRPSIDTTRTLAIYCTGHNDPGDLPYYWASVWDTSGIVTLYRFFEDNSGGKYLLYCDPIVDTVGGEPCPFEHPSLAPDAYECTGGGEGFADTIFSMVDSVVDFADYDEDRDAIVDGFFFIILASHFTGCACLGDYSYTTHDTTSSGDTIRVLGERGAEIRFGLVEAPNQAEFVHHCAHQWGHQLGLPDLYKAKTW
jgi:M6 family metalloprotease-like protein